jgi:hypothetical protein
MSRLMHPVWVELQDWDCVPGQRLRWLSGVTREWCERGCERSRPAQGRTGCVAPLSRRGQGDASPTDQGEFPRRY